MAYSMYIYVRHHIMHSTITYLKIARRLLQYIAGAGIDFILFSFFFRFISYISLKVIWRITERINNIKIGNLSQVKHRGRLKDR